MENKRERGSFLFFWADSHWQICPFVPYRFSNPRKAYQSKHGGGDASVIAIAVSFGSDRVTTTITFSHLHAADPITL